MIKREAKAQIVFSHYLKARWTHGPACFELKYTDEKSIPFSAVQPHQITALYAVESTGLYYKIPDDSIGQKPFDCFYLTGVQGYVVLFFGRNFYIIPVEAFVHESKTSTRKSITEDVAKNIAFLSVSY